MPETPVAAGEQEDSDTQKVLKFVAYSRILFAHVTNVEDSNYLRCLRCDGESHHGRELTPADVVHSKGCPIALAIEILSCTASVSPPPELLCAAQSALEWFAGFPHKGEASSFDVSTAAEVYHRLSAAIADSVSPQPTEAEVEALAEKVNKNVKQMEESQKVDPALWTTEMSSVSPSEAVCPACYHPKWLVDGVCQWKPGIETNFESICGHRCEFPAPSEEEDHICDGIFGGPLGYSHNKPCSICGEYKSGRDSDTLNIQPTRETVDVNLKHEGVTSSEDPWTPSSASPSEEEIELQRLRQAIGWISDAADAAYIEDENNKYIHDIFNIAAKAAGITRRLPDEHSPFEL